MILVGIIGLLLVAAVLCFAFAGFFEWEWAIKGVVVCTLAVIGLLGLIIAGAMFGFLH